MAHDQKPSLSERFGQGVQRAISEMGAELKRLGTLGSYEAGAAIQAFPPGESIYRGDIGMLSNQAGQQPGGLETLQSAQGYQAQIPPPEQSERQSQSL